jgi:hypothetical protein
VFTTPALASVETPPALTSVHNAYAAYHHWGGTRAYGWLADRTSTSTARRWHLSTLWWHRAAAQHTRYVQLQQLRSALTCWPAVTAIFSPEGAAALSMARTIVYRESRGNPTVTNTSSGAAGCWQWMPFWWQSKWNPYDPWTATQMAHTVWQREGFAPWGE